MVHNALDLALFFEVADGNPRKRAIDLQSFDEDGLADEAEGGDLLNDAVEQGLVKGNGVLGLVLDLALRPLLFLSSLSAA